MVALEGEAESGTVSEENRKSTTVMFSCDENSFGCASQTEKPKKDEVIEVFHVASHQLDFLTCWFSFCNGKAAEGGGGGSTQQIHGWTWASKRTPLQKYGVKHSLKRWKTLLFKYVHLF